DSPVGLVTSGEECGAGKIDQLGSRPADVGVERSLDCDTPTTVVEGIDVDLAHRLARLPWDRQRPPRRRVEELDDRRGEAERSWPNPRSRCDLGATTAAGACRSCRPGCAGISFVALGSLDT